MSIRSSSAAAQPPPPPPADLLPDPTLRVSFQQHGADWNQGNCASRRLQSPININELYVPPTNTFSFAYRAVNNERFDLSNDGRVITADVSGLRLGGLSLPHAMAPGYELQRIDVHSPSEHTLRGKHLPLEVQLVHAPPTEYPGNQIVTVSLLFNSTMPPQREQVWPGLLQAQSAGLRGRLDRFGDVTGAGAGVDSDASATLQVKHVCRYPHPQYPPDLAEGPH